LVIGQHGGHYGTGRWNFDEDHELSIADSYLSWGWSNPAVPKIKPVGNLKAKRSLRGEHAVQLGAVLVTCALPRLSYVMYSIPVAGQFLDYLEDQFTFVKALPGRVRALFTARLYKHDYGWDQELRWRERVPGLRLDEGKVPMEQLLSRSRLCVVTYNASAYLESFAMNVPTILYWKPEHWELRSSAEPWFDELKRARILHETPESAARHVAAIWDNVDAWWSNVEVQTALARFGDRYSRHPEDMPAAVESALRDAMVPLGSAV